MAPTGKIQLSQTPVDNDRENFVSMETVLLTLVDLNSDEIEEFFNKCHGHGGKFCSTGGSAGGDGAVKDAEGAVHEAQKVHDAIKKVGVGGKTHGRTVSEEHLRTAESNLSTAKAELEQAKASRTAEKAGKPFAVVNAPHDGFSQGKSDIYAGTREIEGVRGWDAKGKPVPGTDAWIEAHGMTRKVFENRPYERFEKNKEDPAIKAEYGDYPKDYRIFKGVAGQTSGYIMKRSPAPDSPYGKILGEVRPDTRVVLDPGTRARRLTELNNSKARLEEVSKFTKADLVKDRKASLVKAQENLNYVKNATPETLRRDAADRLTAAHKGLEKAGKGGDIAEIKDAQLEVARAKRNSVKQERRAKGWRPEAELFDAQTAVTHAQSRVEAVNKDPEKALHRAKVAAELDVKRRENRYEKSAIKYTFPSEAGSAKRVDVQQDRQNLKNLTTGKGRVYFAMEGCIKADAVLTSVKKEDPTATVISVPSVTLWQTPETKWITEKYLKGREVVLLPDADGVHNPDVVRQAKGLQAALTNFGAGRVFVASPPLDKGRVGEFKLRSGLIEERKGIDDHLGAGRGTLGELTFTEQSVPHISLKEFTREGGAVGARKINKNGLHNAEATMTAISSIAGQRGIAKVPKNMLSQAAGIPQTSAYDAREKLKELGLIKVEYVFNQEGLSRGKRIPEMSDERIHELVRQKVIKQPRLDQPFTSIDFDESPVISILDKKYIAADHPASKLSSIDTWKPPRSFKGWTSPITGKTKAEEGVLGIRKPSKKASLKRAPSGKKLVRTQEGAKRYGVSIGDIVPAAPVASVLSTVMLGSQETVEVDPEIFYNHNHGPGGKFAPGGRGSGGGGKDSKASLPVERGHGGKSGGKESKLPVSGGSGSRAGWPKVSGREVTEAKRGLGDKLVGNKGVYEVHLSDGSTLRMYDKVGGLTENKKQLLNGAAALNEMYPRQHHDLVNVSARSAAASGVGNAFAWVQPGNKHIFLNDGNLQHLDEAKGLAHRGWLMPEAAKGGGIYFPTHEFGHQYDLGNRRQGAHALFYNKAIQDHLSVYGRANFREGYAEAFAEWHVSQGQTKNPAAIAYARHENWHGASATATKVAAASESGSWVDVLQVLRIPFVFEPKIIPPGPGIMEFGLNVTGSIHLIPLPPGTGSIHLSNQEDTVPLSNQEDTVSPDDELKTGPDDKGFDPKGQIIADSFDGKTLGKILGDWVDVPVTDAEKAKADQIVAEVLKELGLNG